jgi:hypothetical protein
VRALTLYYWLQRQHYLLQCILNLNNALSSFAETRGTHDRLEEGLRCMCNSMKSIGATTVVSIDIDRRPSVAHFEM